MARSHHAPVTDRELAATYLLHFEPLARMAAETLGLPDADARRLAHEALLASLVCRQPIVNMEEWLAAAVTEGARLFREGGA